MNVSLEKNQSNSQEFMKPILNNYTTQYGKMYEHNLAATIWYSNTL